MKKLAIIVFAVIALVWIVGKPADVTPSPSAEAEAAAEAAQAQAFTQAVSAKLPANPKWNGIHTEEANSRSYRLVLTYQVMPSSQAEVSRDTRAVVQAALDELVRQGRSPSQEQIIVTVWAHKAEKGATGQNLTRVFGRSVYDYNDDTVAYKPKD